MKLLIKFPTRKRSKKFLSTLNTYIDFLDDKNTEFIISCDVDDISMNNQEIKDYLSCYQNVKIFYGNNNTKVEAINANLKNVDFDIILLASDDMIPIVKGFDTIIKNKMSEYYPDTDGVLWFNDGFKKKELNTLIIIGKKYYDRFNYLYFPQYKSIFCDNEFTEVSILLNKQTYFDDVIIQHQHPDWGFGQEDEIQKMNRINSNHDYEVYNLRSKLKFGLL